MILDYLFILISSYFRVRVKYSELENQKLVGLEIKQISTAWWKVKAAWPLRNFNGPSSELKCYYHLGALQENISVLVKQLDYKLL